MPAGDLMSESGNYYLIPEINAVVQVVRWITDKWITDSSLVEDDQYLVRGVLSGEESFHWTSQFGRQLNEMEVLAYASRVPSHE